MELQVATYNVRGIRDNVKGKEIFHYLQKQPHDIILLQETHSSKSIEKIWRAQWGGKFIFCHGNSNARVVAILTKSTIDIKPIKIIRGNEGRLVAFTAMIHGKMLTLANIYAPNDEIQNSSTKFSAKLRA